MEELIKPYVTGEYYRPSEAVRIVNHAQANFYLANNVPLLDIYVNRGMTIYVFYKKASYPYFKIWCERKRENEDKPDES